MSTQDDILPQDIIETRRGLSLHHGRLNDRLYVMSIAPSLLADTTEADTDLASSLEEVVDFATRVQRYSKIKVKAPERKRQIVERILSAHRVRDEAVIPDYYGEGDHAVYFAAYPVVERPSGDPREGDQDWRLPRIDARFSGTVDIVRSTPPGEDTTATAKAPRRAVTSPPAVHICGPSDAEELAALYRAVFPRSYPFPVTQPSFIRMTMDEGTTYYCIRDGCDDPALVATGAARPQHHRPIVAACSAERDRKTGRAAEMTDFATHADFLGRGYASRLLEEMEHHMAAEGVTILFTICRARIEAVNRLFRRAGYTFTGCLRNNTHIDGTIEDMNVLVKKIG